MFNDIVFFSFFLFSFVYKLFIAGRMVFLNVRNQPIVVPTIYEYTIHVHVHYVRAIFFTDTANSLYLLEKYDIIQLLHQSRWCNLYSGIILAVPSHMCVYIYASKTKQEFSNGRTRKTLPAKRSYRRFYHHSVLFSPIPYNIAYTCV